MDNPNDYMKSLIDEFPDQIEKALSISADINLNTNGTEIHNMVLSGLGGSGIGGTIASQLVQDELEVPVVINNDYTLPNFVSSHTLLVISSYSGNTEETIAALEEGMKKNAYIVCITSNGQIQKTAEQNSIPHILLPGGYPPRAALAYSLTQQLAVMNLMGLIGDSYINDLHSSIDIIKKQKEIIQNNAAVIAQGLKGKVPVIYTEAGYEGIGVRFRQQLNENSKVLCWHHFYPEMNHNELVGWSGGNDNLAVIVFRNKDDHERSSLRMNICKELISQKTSNYFEIESKGDSKIERAIYSIHLGDWVSAYLADERGVDAVEVKVIDHLKGELNKN